MVPNHPPTNSTTGKEIREFVESHKESFTPRQYQTLMKVRDGEYIFQMGAMTDWMKGYVDYNPNDFTQAQRDFVKKLPKGVDIVCPMVSKNGSSIGEINEAEYALGIVRQMDRVNKGKGIETVQMQSKEWETAWHKENPPKPPMTTKELYAYMGMQMPLEETPKPRGWFGRTFGGQVQVEELTPEGNLQTRIERPAHTSKQQHRQDNKPQHGHQPHDSNPFSRLVESAKHVFGHKDNDSSGDKKAHGLPPKDVHKQVHQQEKAHKGDDRHSRGGVSYK